MRQCIGKEIASRLLQAIPVLLGVTFVAFFFLQWAPSDPVTIRLSAGGAVPDPVMVAELRHQMGLDRPLLVQYGDWLLHFISGDWGRSFISDQAISAMLLGALPYTVGLAVLVMIITLLLSLPIGLLMAMEEGATWERFLGLITFVLNAVPSFIVGLFLLYVFSYQLHLIPVLAMNGPLGLVLPVITLVLVMSSRYIRQIREAALEELHKPYVIGLRARGLSERKILFSAIRLSITPTLITLSALSFGSLLGGTVIVETIFNWPGLGQLLLTGIINRDYVLVQGIIVWMSSAYLVVNLLADVVTEAINPPRQIL